ncbi:hypothetical protein, partial [Haemophilus influenzae]|uniref:hypothetical protein n=1 Tax=Haemophilus influenzae TaxID=727 RepID=UPI001E309729
LESLFIGDMESEECEISWIKQGDYSRLYAALPNLKKLTIKGTQDLELGEIAHDKLEHLEIISGGTPCNVFASLQNSQLPALKTLIVYIGVEDYGFDASLESLFIGDMESEECEISWIKQGDYSRLYAALPN